ncbi:MAG: UMP kinase [bacterium]|nr:UMP kinase [bacterium]
MNPVYKRVLLKFSGESLSGTKNVSVDPSTLEYFAHEVKSLSDMGVEVAIVIGGGNIWRGDIQGKDFKDQAQSHFIGMLSGIINCLAFQDSLEKLAIPTRVMTALRMENVAEPYIRRKAIRHLEKGRVVILGGGTGNPFFSHDSAATLRAAEIHAEVLLMAKNGVDGVYTADPKIDSSATLLENLDYEFAINEKLRVMDLTALTFAQERKLPIVVFNGIVQDNLKKIVLGEKIGSRIS